ncbi:MAG TPA: DUF4118 domain-containing protein, partial [Armatimonadota bacterium]|nr:DUF4118 domain-containing protein [Armatimonadota bacterium]
MQAKNPAFRALQFRHFLTQELPRGAGPPTPPTLWHTRPPLLGYGVALAATLVTLGLRALLWPVVGETSPFVLFIPGVIVTAWYGGLAPALLATVLGAVTGFYCFTEPRFTFILGEPKDAVRVLLYVAASLAAAWLSVLRWRAEESQRRDNRQLAYLADVANDLLLHEQPEPFLGDLYEDLAPLLELDTYLCYLVTPDGRLRLSACQGIPEDLKAALEKGTAGFSAMLQSVGGKR